jgi:hypothetical protein
MSKLGEISEVNPLTHAAHTCYRYIAAVACTLYSSHSPHNYWLHAIWSSARPHPSTPPTMNMGRVHHTSIYSLTPLGLQKSSFYWLFLEHAHIEHLFSHRTNTTLPPPLPLALPTTIDACRLAVTFVLHTESVVSLLSFAAADVFAGKASWLKFKGSEGARDLWDKKNGKIWI